MFEATWHLLNPLLTLLLEHGAQILIVYDISLKTDDSLFLLVSWCLDALLDLGSPSVSRGKVTIDIGASLARITMNGLNVDFWPPQAAVSALATEGAKQKKTGVGKPFVMADMNKFVPLWMVDDCELGDDLDETQERDQNPCAVEALTKALGLPQAKKKKGTRER